MNFTDLMVALDVAVEAHLMDDATYTPTYGVPSLVRVAVAHPVEIERFQGAGFSRARPTLTISFAAAPELQEGDTFWISDDEVWRVAAAPTRSNTGWWTAEVEPG